MTSATSASTMGIAPHQIKIKVNKEESVASHLVKEHKSNMSLLYYDFNNTNQRQLLKQKQNLADLIIPEEAEEGKGDLLAL